MRTEQIVSAIEPLLRDFVDQETARRVIALKASQLATRDQADAEILRAAKSVGQASDRLDQARFNGANEALARMQVTAASRRLAAVMKKHRRLA